MNNKIKALILISVFIGCHFLMRSLWGEGWSELILALDQQTYLLLMPAKYGFLYGALVVAALWLFRDEPWQHVLGVALKDSLTYFMAALMCCLPMVLGYIYLSSELNLSLANIVTGSIYAGLFEELVFRAVLFGVLFRYCRWGFVPAELVSSVVFGLGHIYQGNDLMSGFLAFAITAVAGTWFAWLYCECGYRIWFPLWMHILMNAAYTIFGMSGGAAGELEANVFKYSSIALSIVYIYLVVGQGKKREITMATLWRNPSPQSK
ncbi:MAG: CPBP family intramembrane metalloprotease [Psychrobium sp.]|nr:CPBP family intramembrane metalloprotease [Psychrobium sp.]